MYENEGPDSTCYWMEQFDYLAQAAREHIPVVTLAGVLETLKLGLLLPGYCAEMRKGKEDDNAPEQ